MDISAPLEQDRWNKGLARRIERAPLAALLEALPRLRSRLAISRALYILGKRCDRRAGPAVADFLHHAEAAVRSEAAQTLSHLACPELADDITAALRTEEEPMVQGWLALAAYPCRADEAVPKLVRLLESASSEVRTDSAASLGALGAVDALGPLSRAREAEDDASARFEMDRALAGMRLPRPVCDGVVVFDLSARRTVVPFPHWCLITPRGSVAACTLDGEGIGVVRRKVDRPRRDWPMDKPLTLTPRSIVRQALDAGCADAFRTVRYLSRLAHPGDLLAALDLTDDPEALEILFTAVQGFGREAHQAIAQWISAEDAALRSSAVTGLYENLQYDPFAKRRYLTLLAGRLDEEPLPAIRRQILLVLGDMQFVAAADRIRVSLHAPDAVERLCARAALDRLTG